jgi:hypothetical protein
VTICFIQPADAIAVIVASVGREARRLLVGEVVDAWVDDLPERDLAPNYAKAVADLDEHDLSTLATWHESIEMGRPVATKDFLVGVFSALGENQRDALRVAVGLRSEDAFDAGVDEIQTIEAVLPRLSEERAKELAETCVELYLWDRLGVAN